MPSQLTHLAVAKRFMQKHPQMIEDVVRFLDGNVAPDLNPDKAASHCGDRSERVNIVKHNLEKVNPAKFAQTHDMTDDYNKGQYLHLYVDDKYYNEFLLWYFQQARPGEQITTDMYETTRRDEVYLRAKYHVEYSDTSLEKELQALNDQWDEKHAVMRRQAGYCFYMPYDLPTLEQFIEQMADADIPRK